MSSPLTLAADLVDIVANQMAEAPMYLHTVGWRRSMLAQGTFDTQTIRAVSGYLRTAATQGITSVDWKAVFQKLSGLKGNIEGVISGGFITPVPDAVRDAALADLLHAIGVSLVLENSVVAGEACFFLGVFQVDWAESLQAENGETVRVPHHRVRIDFQRLIQVFQGGKGLVTAALRGAGANVTPQQADLAVAILLVVRGFLEALGLQAQLALEPAGGGAALGGLRLRAAWPATAPLVPLGGGVAATAALNLGLAFQASATTWPSAVVGVGATGQVIFNGGLWRGGLELTGGPIEFLFDGRDVTLLSAQIGKVALAITRLADDAAATGSGLFLGERKLTVAVGAAPGGVAAELGLSATGNKLVIKPSPDDGFLKAVLPADGIGLGFDLAVGWSNTRGFSVSGGVGFHKTIAVNQNIAGIIEIDDVDIDVRGDIAQKAITSSIAVSGAIKLGPVRGVVEQIGLQLALGFPQGGGNLGAANLAFGLKPPKGLGLSIKATAVKGGGYLSLDYEKHEYAGVGQLEISGGYGLTAIGILNTRLPGDVEGFSLLLIVCLTLGGGIAIGFGFFLAGLGGLLGVNRDYQEDEIRRGISDGTIDSILFPPNPVDNARKVVADVKRVFPPAQDKFVIGLMARITWGQPRLITCDLGLIVALPDVVITIIGRLRLDLPDPNDPVLALRVTFQGTLSFPKRRLTFDATVAGSRLLTFALTGQMGMLLKWGEGATFAMSVGGYHPKFQPPAELAITERMGIAIFNEKDLRLRLGTYLAITTNTLQLGVELDFYFAKELGPIGKLEIQAGAGFDVLIQLKPFHFIVSTHGQVTVARNGTPLAALTLRVSIEGPGRWIIDGEVFLKFLIWEVREPIHKEFGDEPPEPVPPARNVEELVLQEVAKAACWTAALPERSESSLMFRDVAGETKLVLHPFGTLSVRQRVAPLGISLAKFGESRIDGTARVDISEVVVSGLARPGAAATDLFARGPFFAHPDGATDDQKAQEPQFETFACGVQGIGGTGYTASSLGQTDTFDYETLVIDDPVLPAAKASGVVAALTLEEASTRAASARLAGDRLIDLTVDRRVRVTEPRYVAMAADGADLGGTTAATRAGFSEAQTGAKREPGARRQRVIPEWDTP